MQGTILILDGVSTNRIMLKVQLSAAYYHVVQSDGLDGLLPLVRRTRPDVILSAMTLPDGTALGVRRLLQTDPVLATIPIVAVTPQNDRAARLTALGTGIDDVLSQPLDDVILQARIRSLIRTHDNSDDLHSQDETSSALGFAEPLVGFEAAAQITLLTGNAVTGARWRNQLKQNLHHDLRTHQMGDIHALMSDQVPDAMVIELTNETAEAALRLMADLHARSSTRHAAIIAVTDPANPKLAADALDRGAHDVMPTGFSAEELALRLTVQLRHKARTDQMRDTVRNGLRAAVRDPMTGLYNRRYALPQLARIAQQAAETGGRYAVMLADLDHFKQINDQYGHLAGDAVLIEAADRLRNGLQLNDLIARVGGEEFMIVMPAADQASVSAVADTLCRKINGRPFVVPGIDQPIRVTISIGVVIGPPPEPNGGTGACNPSTTALISQADRALYCAKDAGRNQVTLIRAAA